MIGFLRGTILDKRPNILVVDVGGVGYEVHVPLSTYYGLSDVGSPVSLRVHTHVREDVLALFGFATRLEQELFERLIAISGIGPRLALAVLSGIEPVHLINAVMRGDLASLTAIPGIGKKTAERITLELKDRLPLALTREADAHVPSTEPLDGLRRDLISALLNLGYHRGLAERAAEAAMKTEHTGSFETALKQALKEMAK